MLSSDLRLAPHRQQYPVLFGWGKKKKAEPKAETSDNKTLEHAHKAFDDGYYRLQKENEKSLKKRFLAAIPKLFSKRNLLIGLTSAGAVVGVQNGINNIQSYNNLTTTVNALEPYGSVFSENWLQGLSDQAERALWTGVGLLAASTLLAGATGYTVRKKFQASDEDIETFRAILKDARIAKDMMNIHASQDEFEKNVALYLKRKVQQEAKAISAQIHTNYQDPDARKDLDRLYSDGEKTELPTSKDVINLAFYYAYQSLHKEQEKLKPHQRGVDELKFMMRTYVFLTVLKSKGKLFETMEHDKKAPFQESLKKILKSEAELIQLDLALQIDNLRIYDQEKRRLTAEIAQKQQELTPLTLTLLNGNDLLADFDNKEVERKRQLLQEKIAQIEGEIQELAKKKEHLEQQSDFNKENLLDITRIGADVAMEKPLSNLVQHLVTTQSTTGISPALIDILQEHPDLLAALGGQTDITLKPDKDPLLEEVEELLLPHDEVKTHENSSEHQAETEKPARKTQTRTK